MNPTNSSNSTNPIVNALTIDLEDYFQVHAFSNVIRFEDWDKHESRIERNTFRLLDILHECKPNFLSNVPNSLPLTSNLKPQGFGFLPPTSDLSPHDSKFLPPTSNLKPQGFGFLPPTSDLKPQSSIRATFFILGWVAERYPHLIRTIKDQGHEIACHGYAHKLIYTQSKDEFRGDIRKAKAILEDITGDKVIGYRAPSYSITQKSKWALEILMEEGFKYDSSIFPIHHDFYGFPQAPRFPFLISMNGNNNFEFSLLNLNLEVTPQSAFRNPQCSTQSLVLSPSHSVLSPHDSVLNSQSSVNPSNPMNASNSINPSNSSNSSNSSNPATSSKFIEFPISTLRICGQNLPLSGGGYFRLFPYSLIKRGLRRINEEEEQPFIFYIHPWELDPDQPRLNSVSLKSRFRHYINLDKTESRFKKFLLDFRFSSIKDLLKTNISTS